MPQTPDRKPGPLQELEEIQLLTPSGSVPSIEGGIVYDPGAGAFQLKDSVGTFNPRSGGSGITEAQHKLIDQLVHNIAETHYLEIVRTSGQISDIIHWTNSGKTQKIRETSLTRSSGQVSEIVIKQYNGSGTLVETITGVVARTSGQITSIQWTFS